ncbi:MAG: CBS domain-containing protein [Thermotogae bacterium]|nr:MAG: CBS domain-containing protein [Thermotogota bacterium]
MKVKDVLIRDISAVFEDETVEDFVRICSMQSFSGLPVVDENMVVVGYISENDVINAAVPSYFSLLQSVSFLPDTHQLVQRLQKIKEHTVSQYMRTPAVTVKEEDSLIHVADLIIRRRLKVVPVVDDQGRLVGIVTRMGVLKGAMEKGG